MSSSAEMPVQMQKGTAMHHEGRKGKVLVDRRDGEGVKSTELFQGGFQLAGWGLQDSGDTPPPTVRSGGQRSLWKVVLSLGPNTRGICSAQATQPDEAELQKTTSKASTATGTRSPRSPPAELDSISSHEGGHNSPWAGSH